jgi:hypothetical protein
MLRPTLPALVCVLAAAACTGTGYESAVNAEGPARTEALLLVEDGQAPEGGAIQVGARFFSVTGFSDDALPELVGTPRLPRENACEERALPGHVSGGEVRLLDVGAVDVRAGTVDTRMSPRRFPDLWNVVSGVLYGTEGSFPAGTWRFAAPGSAASGIGAFEVSAVSPDPIRDVMLNERITGMGPGAVISLPRSGSLSLRWSRGSDPGDRVAIAFEGASVIVCGARDEGSLDIDAGWMDRIRDIARGEAQVAVRRIRVRPFSAPGADRARLVFDIGTRARLRVE